MIAPDQSFSFQIRSMRAEDLAQVQTIDKNSFSLPWPTSAFNFELSNPRSLLWVAEIPASAGLSKIVGMIIIWLIVDEAHIATLAVDADYRRNGIGQLLLATALIEAINKGMRVATLEVRAGNMAAQHLYHRFLFDIVGFRPRYYRDNSEDALIMSKNNLGEAYLAWLENGSWKKKVDPASTASTTIINEVHQGEEYTDGSN